MVRFTFYFRFAANWRFRLATRHSEPVSQATTECQHHYPRVEFPAVSAQTRWSPLSRCLLKCDRHDHLSCDGEIRRVKGDRLDNSCWGRKFDEPCRETVFPLRGFAAVHLLG